MAIGKEGRPGDLHHAARLVDDIERSGYAAARRDAEETLAVARSLVDTEQDRAIGAPGTESERAGPRRVAELGARPAETLMVGDSRWDLEMARNAGVDSVAVLGGATVEAELRDCGPLRCLPGVAELPGFLGLATSAGARAG